MIWLAGNFLACIKFIKMSNICAFWSGDLQVSTSPAQPQSPCFHWLVPVRWVISWVTRFTPSIVDILHLKEKASFGTKYGKHFNFFLPMPLEKQLHFSNSSVWMQSLHPNGQRFSSNNVRWRSAHSQSTGWQCLSARLQLTLGLYHIKTCVCDQTKIPQN